MKQISFWIPAAFSAFLSLMPLFGSLIYPQGGDSWWKPAYFAFQPMCFFFVGSALLQMHREWNGLRERLAQLEGKRSS